MLSHVGSHRSRSAKISAYSTNPEISLLPWQCRRLNHRLTLRELNLSSTAPATLDETVTLKTMVAVSADTKVLARLHLTHCRVVNFYCVRYYDLFCQRHFSTAIEKANALYSML